jgi:uncharacterized membrane protein
VALVHAVRGVGRRLRAAGIRGRRASGAVVVLAVVGSLCAALDGTPVGAVAPPGSLPAPAPVPHPAVQVYVGLAAAPTARQRAQLAVAALRRGGAFDGAAVLVAVPTGSGWVDPVAVGALAGPGVATVAVQYAARPSWQEYLLDPGAAQEAAVALVAALRAHVDTLPAAARPRLWVHGESLGALAARATVQDADAVLVAGTPGGMWLPPVPRAVAVCHSDDPVCWFSPRLLTRRPPGWSGPWLPVVSFWLTAAALPVAVGAPPGHGHHYGPELLPPARAGSRAVRRRLGA